MKQCRTLIGKGDKIKKKKQSSDIQIQNTHFGLVLKIFLEKSEKAQCVLEYQQVNRVCLLLSSSIYIAVNRRLMLSALLWAYILKQKS